jgi:uncharacterized membrane protein HdeD (DUF308 family)
MLLSGVADTMRFLARARGRDVVLVASALTLLVLLLLLSDPVLGGWALALEPGPARP